MVEGRPVPCHASTSAPAARAHAGGDGPGLGFALHQQKKMNFLISSFSPGVMDSGRGGGALVTEIFKQWSWVKTLGPGNRTLHPLNGGVHKHKGI